MGIFKELESNVRGYCRHFDVIFKRAKNAELFDVDGNRYIDFLGGAGTLNYGHNNDKIKPALIDYINEDGVTHGLDMHTVAKEAFIRSFDEIILQPREMSYRFQFVGPTGTNAVEAALKLARKVTGRQHIVSFTNGFHGATMGAATVSANPKWTAASNMPQTGVTFMPYDRFHEEDWDSLAYLESMLADGSSGLEKPAAVIVECIQGEGGLNAARGEWLKELNRICAENDILLIVDDIQAGCGRSGWFFSFEKFGIKPDLITLSKSLSAYGLPMAIVLIGEGLDVWSPGEHTGTFRGNNHAFVTAKRALELYWQDDAFQQETRRKAQILHDRFAAIVDRYPDQLQHRGRGMMQGIAFMEQRELAAEVSKKAFEEKLIIETSGSDDHVVKFLAPLTIEDEVLNEGLDILDQAFAKVLD
ncbi:diaminobutyrate--2-oxoglutarate transaminase [Suttonella sp. R2A3]|uniref:diaminobutyrate--2-oxoglutarate transaminase n=1 Tax=Suttonella sp. R2A3 TaxID=2908648 RepID=UPI001F262031|nr:diaminobutyrate--2-oxoglutarate transaminase [Suttonella sp. R2A3]UJF24501.1 diaminobutyrate--2-oxoglutarate transaminase [Suttonella sp. R2A3]